MDRAGRSTLLLSVLRDAESNCVPLNAARLIRAALQQAAQTGDAPRLDELSATFASLRDAEEILCDASGRLSLPDDPALTTREYCDASNIPYTEALNKKLRRAAATGALELAHKGNGGGRGSAPHRFWKSAVDRLLCR